MFCSCKTLYFGVLHLFGQPNHWSSIVFCYSWFVQNDTPKTLHSQVLVSIEQQTSQWIHSKKNFFCCTIKSKSIFLNLRLFESRHRSNRRPLSVPRLTRFPEWLAKKWMTTHSIDLIYIKFQIYTHLPKVCQFIVFPKIYFIRIKNYWNQLPLTKRQNIE